MSSDQHYDVEVYLGSIQVNSKIWVDRKCTCRNAHLPCQIYKVADTRREFVARGTIYLKDPDDNLDLLNCKKRYESYRIIMPAGTFLWRLVVLVSLKSGYKPLKL